MSNKKEIWKTFTIDGKKPTVPYAISNHGRFGVMSEDGKVEVRSFKPTAGNYRFNTRQNGKNKAIFLEKIDGSKDHKRNCRSHSQIKFTRKMAL